MAEEDGFYKQPTRPKLTDSKSDAPPERIPEKIGPYKIQALLNKGGMSYLYLATHPETGGPVAIKVLSKKFMSQPEVVQRFINEAEIISMTDHPNIVKMYTHGEWEGGLFIAMEYLEGISLRKYLLHTPLSLKRSLSIILDIAYALCHLHTHGVIHRDLKPENILVTEMGTIKVIDFGISQLLTEKDATPSGPQKHRWIGTPIYISPEQKETPEKVSFPSDIYSLGIISYELILGKLSHGHIHLSLMPKGMQPILMKCLQPKPEDRYHDIVDFITDVSAYLNSPVLQQERVAGDQLSEISEEIRLLQASLTPLKTPQWPGMEMGVAVSKGLNIRGLYYDFLPVGKETYGIMLAESSAKGTEGFTATAVLRGMVRALYTFTAKPIELLTIINAILLRDEMNIAFNAGYFFVNPKENQINCISCGQVSFWKVPSGMMTPEIHVAETEPLGVVQSPSWKEKTFPFNVGDLFLFYTSSPYAKGKASGTVGADTFSIAIQETMNQSPQLQVESILRKMRIASSESPLERAQVVISLRRTA